MRCARAVVIAVVLAIVPEAFCQQQAERALLPVKVNEIARGDVLAYVGSDDVFVPKSFLQNVDLLLPSAQSRLFDEEPYVSLASLRPQVTFVFDPAELSLSITADPRVLGHQVVEMQSPSVRQDRGGDPSIFANYALAGQKSGTPSVFTELGASRNNRLLYTALSRTASKIDRGMSFAAVDSPADMRRWTFGDALAGTDPLGGTVVIGGVTLSREFSLQPYLIRTPGTDITGTALTPSTVEVYSNGQLTSRVAVQPGQFTLHDPRTAGGGLGETRVVVRDVFGRETVQESSTYHSTAALAQGLSDYVFSAGALRRNLSDVWGYHDAALLAQYRRGLTSSLTLGGRVEASRGLFSGGPRVTLGTRAGDIDLDLAVSRADGASGTAGWLAYRFNAPRYSFGVAGSKRSENYSTLSLSTTDDRVSTEWSAFASVSVRALSLGVFGTDNEMRSGDRLRRYGVQANVPLSQWMAVSASVGRGTHNGVTQPDVLIGITASLGHKTAANISARRADGRDSIRSEIRRPLGVENGYGFSLERESESNQQLATLQYQSSFGRYEIDVDPRKVENAGYNIAGGVVMIGGAVLPSRPIQEGFALARVGVPGVRVFASNQEIGRTGSSGDLLVTNLLPHYLNDLSINDKDIPIDYEIQGTQTTVVPPTRGGAIAAFPVRPLRSYTGTIRLMVVGQPFVPALGEVDVTVGADKRTLGLGRNGEFYIDDVSPATYAAKLRIGKVDCTFQLTIPQSKTPTTDLGVIPCVP